VHHSRWDEREGDSALSWASVRLFRVLVGWRTVVGHGGGAGRWSVTVRHPSGLTLATGLARVPAEIPGAAELFTLEGASQQLFGSFPYAPAYPR
jgi:hypothetical protein